jgi:hypothetical protein
MNERFKQLAVEARLLTGWPVGEVEYQRFAELIIQECINQVKEQYVPVLEDTEMMKDTHWDGYVQCGVDSVVGIREHFFGVEE